MSGLHDDGRYAQLRAAIDALQERVDAIEAWADRTDAEADGRAEAVGFRQHPEPARAARTPEVN